MKTYASLEGKDNDFDWNDFLRKAIQLEPNWNQKKIAQTFARSWTTCACGQQCNIIPRNTGGCPIDSELYHLGCMFMSCIDLDEWEKAQEILQKIEQRSAKLIEEIENEAW